jgi:hypothetical protein
LGAENREYAASYGVRRISTGLVPVERAIERAQQCQSKIAPPYSGWKIHSIRKFLKNLFVSIPHPRAAP